MFTLVIGVRHANAPIEVREQLAFSSHEHLDALRDLSTYPGIEEAAILSTCNRTEIYATVSDTHTGMQSLKSFLKDYKSYDYNEQMAHSFLLLHEDAVIHLFRVASGLDSLILGEGQILSQLKEALKLSMEAGTSGDVVEKLFKSALSVGKAVRAETGISSRDPNIPKAALSFVHQNYPEALNGPITVLGAGKIADILLDSLLAAKPALRLNPEELIVLNRGQQRLEALGSKYGVTTWEWERLGEAIARSSLLIVATGSKHYVVEPTHFSENTQPILVMDIAVPRNVNPVVSELEQVNLFNTDSLQGYGQVSEDQRLRLIHEAHQIIEREYQGFHQWIVGRPAIPVISELRAKIEDVRKMEVADFVSYCPETKKSCGVIDSLSRSLVNKLLHDPTIRLRGTPELEEIYKQAELLSSLFNIPVQGCGTTSLSSANLSKELPKAPVDVQPADPDNVLPLKRKQHY